MQCNTRYYKDWEDFYNELEQRERILNKRRRRATILLLRAYRSDETILRRAIKKFITPRPIRQVVAENVVTEESKLSFFEYLAVHIGISRAYRKNENAFISQLTITSQEMYKLIQQRLGSEFTQESLRYLVRKYSRSITRYYKEGTVNAIRKAYETLIDTGVVDADDLAKSLITNYKSREHIARTVARTAVSEIIGQTQMHAFTQDPVVAYVRWVTVGDDRVRPAHVRNGSLNGGITAKGRAFPGGERYAPSGYNCRCSLEPVVEADVGRRQDGTLFLKPSAIGSR